MPEMLETALESVASSQDKVQRRGVGFVKEQSPTLTAENAPGVCYALQSDGSMANRRNGSGFNDDGSAYTLNTVDKQSVVCIADDNANAAIDDGLSGTLKAGGGGSDDCVGSLCARDYKGACLQDAQSGKLIWLRR